MKIVNPQDRLTTRQFWVDYWAKTKAAVVNEDVFFKPLISYFPKGTQTFLEIGGFPGATTTYFKKFHDYDVTLLDYVIVQDIINDLEKINGLTQGSIQTIEGDLFELQPNKKFDVVFSAGFIEHFTNTDEVFRKHVEYLKTDGVLFISIPNFKGFSGWAQKTFAPDNYAVHNIDCMEKSVLQNLSEKYGLEIQYLEYFGIPHIWLDHPEKASFFGRSFCYIATLLMMKIDKLSQGLLFKGRIFSPFIVLIAKKK